ncbi:hypothetical protein H5410_018979 [Solanum commersonii]|uniref:Uncharacterized protein n=1 Tax=Solanum commersonii TaxID=4109 RepID=A0A9J6A4C8_SOLCO|nr:hypothetical protein H5410_018979 [Solanum commersonii]
MAMLNRIDNHSMTSKLSRSTSSYISPVDYIVQVPSRSFASQIRENYKCDNIKMIEIILLGLCPGPVLT